MVSSSRWQIRCFEGLGVSGPINIGIEVRHGRQRVKRIAALWCERGVCLCRSMEVQTKVFGQHLALEDIIQQAAYTWPQNHGVVGYVGVLALGAEVPDEQPIGIMRAVNLCDSSSACDARA